MRLDANPGPLQESSDVVWPSAAAAPTAVRWVRSIRLQWSSRWAAKGGLALLDQGLFAGGHFAINILLARWLPPAEYGAFALAHSLFLLTTAAYSALMLEPMTVFGAGRYAACRSGYLGVMLYGHLALTLPAAVLLIGVSALAGWVGIDTAHVPLPALALALPLLLLVWLTRRVFYLELRPGVATAGSALYCVLLVSSLLWLASTEMLSPATAILAMGATSFVSGVLQLAWLRPTWSPAARGPVATEVAIRHWRYGRWALATAGMAWLPVNVYYFATPLWGGLEDAGALRALLNLVNPVLHSVVALSMLFLPALARLAQERKLSEMAVAATRFCGVFAVGSAAYMLLLWPVRHEVVAFIYDGKYAEDTGSYLVLAGVLPLAAALSSALTNMLRSLERPWDVFWSYATSAVPGVLVGLFLVTHLGVGGALIGIMAAYVFRSIAMAVRLRSDWHARRSAAP